jgi:hypothetical protein
MARRAMYIGLVSALALVGGCVDFPGTTEGGPCNSAGYCATGLTCVEEICQSEGTPLAWTEIPTGVSDTIAAIWGTDENNVIAVGAAGNILRYHGDAVAGFSPEPAAQTLAASKALKSVWGNNASDIWVVGDRTILHYDASGWSKQKLPDPQEQESYTLYAVHGSSKGVYAVGSSNNTPLVVKHGGGSWSVIDASIHKMDYIGRSLQVLDAMVFVGGSGKRVGFFNGSAWDGKNLINSVDLFAMWGASPTNVYAVGSSGIVAHYDGTSWSTQERRAQYTAHGLWGDAGTRKLFVVGSYSSYTDPPEAVEICGFDSSACKGSVTPKKSSSSTLYTAWGTSSAVFVGGASGTVFMRKVQ